MSTPGKEPGPTAGAVRCGPEAGRLVREASEHDRAGRLREAEASCRQALALEPDLADAHNQLGKVLVALGRLEDAVGSFSRSLEINPDTSGAHNNLGIALRQLGRTDEAIATFERALEIASSNANAHMNLAMTLKETGRLDDAVGHFQQVLAINPGLAQAHFHLAHMRNHVSTDAELGAMKSLYNQPETDTDRKILLAFGLGSALEKRAEYEEAFRFFHAGHRLRKQSAPFDLARSARYFASLKQVFDANSLARNRTAGPANELPVFIIGMPRSGTTLAEQILASHPDVEGAGELSYLEDIVQQVVKKSGKPFLDAWKIMDAREVHDLGADYLQKLRAHSATSRRITDTTPMNFRYVGLVASILPGARFVHCVRNPMDTCMSIFQQPLSETHAYANDLADLGGFYRLYRELMAHWHSVLPGRIYDLCYEDLVTDSETEIRKLLDYCDLQFHEDCLSFHKTDRSVRTPSDSQVRQPIYTGSIGRWKRYEAQLAPLKAILD